MTRQLLLILSALAFLFSSCHKKGGSSGLLVPKDAAIVVHINSASLSSKLSWDEIRQTNWFREMSKDATDTLSRQLLADPASSGIDNKKDFVFYLKKHGRGAYLVFEGSLTNVTAYEKMLTQMDRKQAREIRKDGEYSYVMMDESSVVTWNKSMFAVVANAKIPNMTNRVMGNMQPGNYVFHNDSLQLFGQQALSLENSDNLDVDSRFADLVKDGSDVHLWMKIGQYYNGMNNAVSSMMKVNTMLENNIMAVSLNFDNGRITAKSKHYHSDEMNKILSDNKPEPVSAAVINRIPSSNVVAVLAFNYSPNSLKEILKMTGMDAMADMFLAKINFSIDDFVKANKGEVLLSFSDPTTVNAPDNTDHKNEAPGSVPRMKTGMKVLFATAVNDKGAFEKMVTLGWDLSKQFRRNDDGTGKPEISYKVENNWFAASNSQEYTDKFLAGGNSKLPFVDKITGHPIGIYIDLQKILPFAQSLHKKDSSSGKTAAADASLNIWQDIVGKGGDYKDKASEFEFEINLMDKNTNSLKQLNQYVDKMATLRKEKMQAGIKEVTLEDIKDEPVVVTPPKSKIHHK
ncbi:MAG: DUF4836 family protein [Bacteroidota bacterium]|nr:DUF4836 family protein [Bacteroidota bacterium]